MDISEIGRFCEMVNGWLTKREGLFLYESARNIAEGSGIIVEIGSWQGRSTIWLASGSRVGSKTLVYAIDPHTGSMEHQAAGGKIWTFEKFKENIKKAGVEDLIVPIVKTSEETNKGWNRPIALLWIDGAHEYEFVKKDFELWSPFLVDGGIVAFHDMTGAFPGVVRIVREKIYKDKNFVRLEIVDGILAATKKINPSFYEWAQKRFVVSYKELKDFFGLNLREGRVKNFLRFIRRSLGLK